MRAQPSRDFLQVTPCPLAVTSCVQKMAPKYLLLPYEFHLYNVKQKFSYTCYRYLYLFNFFARSK